MFINLVLNKSIFIYLFKTARITFLSYILLELLDVEHGIPISHKNIKCNSLGLALAIDPPTPMGNFVHYIFQIQHYISHIMRYVSPLRVAALCYVMLNYVTYTTPPPPKKKKITLNSPDNVSNMAYSHFFGSLAQA